MRKVISFLLFGFLVIGCQRPTHDELLSQMQSLPVVLPLDEMECWCPADSCRGKANGKYDLAVVSYADTTDCSMCYIDKLVLWNDFLPLRKASGERLQFYFIVEARGGEAMDLMEKLPLSHLDCPIYVDEKLAFRRENPHIPIQKWYHTFLIDSKGKVLMVGNPLYDEMAEQRFYQMLDSMGIHERGEEGLAIIR